MLRYHVWVSAEWEPSLQEQVGVCVCVFVRRERSGHCGCICPATSLTPYLCVCTLCAKIQSIATPAVERRSAATLEGRGRAERAGNTPQLKAQLVKYEESKYSAAVLVLQWPAASAAASWKVAGLSPGSNALQSGVAGKSRLCVSEWFFSVCYHLDGLMMSKCEQQDEEDI